MAGEHRRISAYGEVTIVGAERKRKPKQQRHAPARKRREQDPRAEFGRLIRKLSFQMAPWRESWDWEQIERLERRIDKLVG